MLFQLKPDRVCKHTPNAETLFAIQSNSLQWRPSIFVAVAARILFLLSENITRNYRRKDRVYK